jgi:tetratricopeptide (TPR) repeat protein
VPEYGQAEYDQKVIESALDEEFLEEMPDDPDEAMTWMAGLAAQQAIKRKGQPRPVAIDVQGDKEQKDGSEGESAPIAENPEFAQARIALTSGNIDEAEAVYRSLLESDQGGPALIQELEKAVSDQPEESQLLQLLGDAYMQNGQLQKALRTYRSGIDHL